MLSLETNVEVTKTSEHNTTVKRCYFLHVNTIGQVNDVSCLLLFNSICHSYHCYCL